MKHDDSTACTCGARYRDFRCSVSYSELRAGDFHTDRARETFGASRELSRGQLLARLGTVKAAEWDREHEWCGRAAEAEFAAPEFVDPFGADDLDAFAVTVSEADLAA